MVFPGDSAVKNPPAHAGDVKDGLNPWARKFPWSRAWQPTPIFLPGESHGQRGLAGYSPAGHKRVRHDLVIKQQQQPPEDFISKCGHTGG